MQLRASARAFLSRPRRTPCFPCIFTRNSLRGEATEYESRLDVGANGPKLLLLSRPRCTT